MIVLHTRNFSAAETAAAANFDSLCAEPHSSADRLLHSTAERSSFLKLRRNALRDKLSVKIRILDLHDVDNDLRRGNLQHARNVQLQLFDLRAAATNYDTRLRAVNEHFDAVCIALDLDLRNAGALQLLLQKRSELIIRNKRVPESFVFREPS